jgi:hypothetical protein
MPKVEILCPVPRYLEPQTESCLRQCEMAGIPVRRLYGFTNLDHARNTLVAEALAAGAEELVWIDADVVFEVEHVEHLRALGLDLVGGLLPQRNVRAFAAHFLPHTEEVRVGESGGPLEVLYTGLGFALTRREVYERIHLPVCNRRWQRPLVPYFQPLVRDDPPHGHWYLHDDFAFCHRAREAGFRVHVDSSLRLYKLGPYDHGWEEAGAAPTRHANYSFKLSPQADPVQPPVPGRLPGDGAGPPLPPPGLPGRVPGRGQHQR